MTLKWEAREAGHSKCRTEDDVVIFCMPEGKQEHMLYAHLVFWDGRTRVRLSFDENIMDIAQRDEVAERLVKKLLALKEAAIK